jgi:hypothetical protein
MVEHSQIDNICVNNPVLFASPVPSPSRQRRPIRLRRRLGQWASAVHEFLSGSSKGFHSFAHLAVFIAVTAQNHSAFLASDNSLLADSLPEIPLCRPLHGILWLTLPQTPWLIHS